MLKICTARHVCKTNQDELSAVINFCGQLTSLYRCPQCGLQRRAPTHASNRRDNQPRVTKRNIFFYEPTYFKFSHSYISRNWKPYNARCKWKSQVKAGPPRVGNWDPETHAQFNTASRRSRNIMSASHAALNWQRRCRKLRWNFRDASSDWTRLLKNVLLSIWTW